MSDDIVNTGLLNESSYANDKQLFVIGLVFSLSSGLHLKCCEPNINWIDDSIQCNKTTLTSLNCSHDFFPLDPITYFTINSSNHIVPLNSKDQLENNFFSRFCHVESVEKYEFIMCFSGELTEPELQSRLRTFLKLCSILSIIFLVLALIMPIILPKLRVVENDTIMSISTYFIGIFFVMGIFKLMVYFPALILKDSSCVSMGFLMYYCYLSTFFWFNIISLNAWRSTWLLYFQVKARKLLFVHITLGWAVPFFFLISALVANFVNRIVRTIDTSDKSCSLLIGYRLKWLYFYAPISVLLIIIPIYISLIVRNMGRKYQDFNRCNLKMLRVKCAIYLKYSFVISFTWFLEVAAFAFGVLNPNHENYWISPNLWNILQGNLNLVLLIILLIKVRKLLAQKNSYNIHFDKSGTVYNTQNEEENYEVHFLLPETWY